MNNLFRKIILLFSLVLTVSSVRAQGSKAPVEEVVNAIKNNRVQDLNKYLDDFVPLTINNAQSNYSHNQAEIVLKDFFDKNPCKAFTIIDSGTPDNYSKFAIGNMTTPNARYVVYILMKAKGSNFLIKELRLNKE